MKERNETFDRWIIQKTKLFLVTEVKEKRTYAGIGILLDYSDIDIVFNYYKNININDLDELEEEPQMINRKNIKILKKDEKTGTRR